ncbi:hypothetical protein NKDENANG_03106 [Candidatus Entotheonellaceae bacterium PAL068K]
MKYDQKMAHLEPPTPQTGILQPLAPVLAQTLRQAGLGHVVLAAQVARHWEDIVGPQLATVARLEGIGSRVLFVTVVDTMWLQQLTFYRAQILDNIRRVLGDVPIDKLHFVLAPAAWAPRQQPEGAGAPEVTSLSPAEKRHMQESTADLVDTELREAVRRAWRRAWQLRRYGT